MDPLGPLTGVAPAEVVGLVFERVGEVDSAILSEVLVPVNHASLRGLKTRIHAYLGI